MYYNDLLSSNPGHCTFWPVVDKTIYQIAAVNLGEFKTQKTVKNTKKIT